MTDQPVRLNKYLAQHLKLGRRAADKLIEDGKVLINGEPAELGGRYNPGDTVLVQGKQLNAEATDFTYLLMNKPTGYVCSRARQGDAPTIYDLLPPMYHHLKTVGRLDKDSSGLIMLTNDGDLAHRLTHPSFEKKKEYEVTLDKPLTSEDRGQIQQGVQLPDGLSALQLEPLSGDNASWRVTMHEGRNRQIRRTFAALDYVVTRLHRTQFGSFTLANLQNGNSRVLDNKDIA